MSPYIQIGARREFQSSELWEMYRLRAKVFKERMKWDIPVLSGMEIDGYDALDPHYLLIKEANNSVRGCWRLLPTEGPYMLRDTFPELLNGRAAPNDARVWELSRFALESDGPQGFGFNQVALESMRSLFLFGRRKGIDLYVTVTTTAIERMMRRAGIVIERFGPPVQIGVEKTVALAIFNSEETREALFGRYQEAA
ncbi:MAG TPA: acyl-homoserine-lactone synthase [Gallionellaceae bacterium]|nr:acyl-homoserine-lactone synthase [Gallionellaceae bacterium]